MSHDANSETHVFIPAKKAAMRYGFEPVSKSGRHGNHTQFLQRLADRHTDFPQFIWLGGRKVYKLTELETFERELLAKSVAKRAA